VSRSGGQGWGRGAVAAALALALGACSPSGPAPPPTAVRPSASLPTAAPTVAGTRAAPQASPTRPAASTSGTPSSASVAARETATFRFVSRLSTPEEIDEIADIVRRQPGILDVTGDEREITLGYDPGRVNPDQIRGYLASAQHPVAP
jgi:hypothetical protein